MPRPDQKTVTLRKDVYEQAKTNAQGESVSSYISNLILNKCKPKEA